MQRRRETPSAGGEGEDEAGEDDVDLAGLDEGVKVFARGIAGRVAHDDALAEIDTEALTEDHFTAVP